MTNKEILSHADHTLLKAVSTWEGIKALCDEAIAYKTASVCVPPSYIKRINEAYGDKLTICTVIGFPLGYSTIATKVFETKEAIANGAKEIDVVIDLGDVKNGDFDKVKNDLMAVREACKDVILKVIIETCYLTEEEKIKMCQIVTEVKADFIKTSTGFGTAGATIEDIKLFKANIGKDVKMKAAGGIRTYEDLVAYLNEGCERLGTSAAVGLLKDKYEE